MFLRFQKKLRYAKKRYDMPLKAGYGFGGIEKIKADSMWDMTSYGQVSTSKSGV